MPPQEARDRRGREPEGSPKGCRPVRLLRPSRLVGRLLWVRWVFLRCRVCRAVRAGSCLQGEVGGQARDRPKGTGPRATGEPRDQARRPRGGLWRGVAEQC